MSTYSQRQSLWRIVARVMRTRMNQFLLQHVMMVFWTVSALYSSLHGVPMLTCNTVYLTARLFNVSPRMSPLVVTIGCHHWLSPLIDLVDNLKRVSISLTMDSYSLIGTVAEPYVNWLFFLQSPLKSTSTHNPPSVSIVNIWVPSGSGKLSDSDDSEGSWTDEFEADPDYTGPLHPSQPCFNKWGVSYVHPSYIVW